MENIGLEETPLSDQIIPYKKSKVKPLADILANLENFPKEHPKSDFCIDVVRDNSSPNGYREVSPQLRPYVITLVNEKTGSSEVVASTLPDHSFEPFINVEQSREYSKTGERINDYLFATLAYPKYNDE